MIAEKYAVSTADTYEFFNRFMFKSGRKRRRSDSSLIVLYAFIPIISYNI